MTVDQHRGSRRRLGASQPLSAQELAAARRLGREWREAWRTEQAGKATGAAPQATPAEPKMRAGQDFAAGIARAAAETGQISAAQAQVWLESRRKASAAEIGHLDLLALPSR